MKPKADICMRGFLKRTPVKTFLSLIKDYSQVLSAEEILSAEASGRILAQKIISPIQTAMIFTLEPVFAGLYNHLFTIHKLSNWGIIAGFIIISGIFYHELKAKK